MRSSENEIHTLLTLSQISIKFLLLAANNYKFYPPVFLLAFVSNICVNWLCASIPFMRDRPKPWTAYEVEKSV